MKKTGKKLPLVTLVGDPLENLYQLGVKDRDKFQAILAQIESLLGTPWKATDKISKELLKIQANKILRQVPEFKNKIEAYAEGLMIDPKRLAAAYLLPEFLSFMSKWLPAYSLNLLGCSSFFMMDRENKSPLHGRILDFPLLESYDLHERAVLYSFNDTPKIFSYGASGLFYPSLTAMTEHGITFALHQIFSDSYDNKGTPIFELIYQLLSNADNKRSAIKFLKKARSLTCWAFHLGFKNGDVLACNINGNELHYEEYKLKGNDILYFNNMPMDKKIKPGDFLPFGIKNYCSMRSSIAKRKIKKLTKIEKASSLDLIESIATPVDQKIKYNKNWKLDTVTSVSVAISTFNAKLGRSHFVGGKAPKILPAPLIEWENIWNAPTQTIIKEKKGDKGKNYKEGMTHLGLSQKYFGQKDPHLAYHHCQMAVSTLKGRPEESICQFYFLVYQYIHETKSKVRKHLLAEFKEIKDKIPDHLKDHCTLFIDRLERILGVKNSVGKKDIKNGNLKKVLTFEKKIPTLLLHPLTSKFILPKPDILDIVYGYVKK